MITQILLALLYWELIKFGAKWAIGFFFKMFPGIRFWLMMKLNKIKERELKAQFEQSQRAAEKLKKEAE